MGWRLVMAAVGVVGVAVSARGWAQAGETATQTAAGESVNAETITGSGGAAGFGAV